MQEESAQPDALMENNLTEKLQFKIVNALKKIGNAILDFSARAMVPVKVFKVKKLIMLHRSNAVISIM